MSVKTDNAVDLLVSEDLDLRRLFHDVQNARGSSVEDRAAYGDLAKEIIRHTALREAALADVTRVMSVGSGLGHVTDRLQEDAPGRRTLFNQAEKMSRGVQGINLNTGQDFDPVLQELIQTVGTEIEWDLGEIVPAVRAQLRQPDSPPRH